MGDEDHFFRDDPSLRELVLLQVPDPTVNHPAERDLAAEAAARVAPVRRDMPPAMTGEDFSEFCWSFVDGKPVQNRWNAFGEVPAQTDLAVEVSKALKARGFKFVGPVIVYAFMQAVGMVNDHLTCCFRHDQVKGMAR